MEREELGSHYRQGYVEQIEVFRIMKDKLTPEQFEGYLLGCIIKYSLRANFKNAFDEDIRKTQHYCRELEEFRDANFKSVPVTDQDVKDITYTTSSPMLDPTRRSRCKDRLKY